MSNNSDYLILRIVNEQNAIEIHSSECTQLELKHNVSSKGKVWSFIGDHLFNFSKLIHNKNEQISNILDVTTEQYQHLCLLQTKKSWTDCKGL